MTGRRGRWALYLAPLVLPWVVAAWDTGHYTMFALGWVDPGPRFVSILTFLSSSAVTLTTRNFTVAYPAALTLYLGALVLLAFQNEPFSGSVPVTALLLLSGLKVVFFGLGVDGQSGITAIPLGAIWLWTLGAFEYRSYLRQPV